MLNKVKVFWRYVRRVTGDDAYEQYLKHFAEHHAGCNLSVDEEQTPLSRGAFFKEWQDKKWKGIKRCC